MLNQEIAGTQSVSRREYNKQYYQKRKQELLVKRKVRSNVFQLFSKKRAFVFENPAGYFRIKKVLEAVIFLILVTIMTAFLISEASKLYLSGFEKPWVAFLKAGTVEVLAILFSFSGETGTAMRWTQRLLVVFLSAFTLFGILSGPIKVASHDISKARASSQTVEALEVELHQKEALQAQLVAKQWLGAARKYEKSIDELRARLATARQATTELDAPAVVLNDLVLMFVFRLLVVMANLVCFHRLAELISFNARQKFDFSVQQVG